MQCYWGLILTEPDQVNTWLNAPSDEALALQQPIGAPPDMTKNSSPTSTKYATIESVKAWMDQAVGFRCTYELVGETANGKGDWMFYGHADASQTAVETWWLIDLNTFRAALIRNGANGNNILMGNQKNPDGTSFKWFDVRSFPADPPLVVASST